MVFRFLSLILRGITITYLPFLFIGSEGINLKVSCEVQLKFPFTDPSLFVSEKLSSTSVLFTSALKAISMELSGLTPVTLLPGIHETTLSVSKSASQEIITAIKKNLQI